MVLKKVPYGGDAPPGENKVLSEFAPGKRVNEDQDIDAPMAAGAAGFAVCSGVCFGRTQRAAAVLKRRAFSAIMQHS